MKRTTSRTVPGVLIARTKGVAFQDDSDGLFSLISTIVLCFSTMLSAARLPVCLVADADALNEWVV